MARPTAAPKRLVALLLSACLAQACSRATFDTRDDLTISAYVKTALLADSELGGLRLGVETFQGVVTLSGTVPTAAARDRAIAVTRKVRGVRDARSALTIAP